jgi:hypothetical protein
MDEPPMPRLCDEASPIQLLQVKGEACRADAKRFCDFSSRNAARPHAHKVAEDGKPVLLGKSGKGSDGGDIFHESHYTTNIELYNKLQIGDLILKRVT